MDFKGYWQTNTAPNWTSLTYVSIEKKRFCGTKRLENLEKRNIAKNGNISKKTAKSIKLAVSWLCLKTPKPKYFKSRGMRKQNKLLTFLTLTLPAEQKHPDRLIDKEIYQHFLDNMRKNNYLNSYVWRKELQGNGNVHWHIISDTPINWEVLRSLWNAACERLGYVSAYRANMQAFHKHGFSVRRDLLPKWSLKQQIKAYQYGVKTNWSKPNSTDVHKLTTVRNVCNYISKYMSKSEEVRQYTGNSWGASQDISALKTIKNEQNDSLINELEQGVAHKEVRKVEGEYYTVYFYELEKMSSIKYSNLCNMLQDYLILSGADAPVT